MITRRSITLLILALALLAPATAQAETKPKKSTPKLFITLTDGAMNKVTVNPTIPVTFSPPKGTTAKAACKGKVTVSVPVGKKTVTVKGKKKKKTIFAKKTASIKSPLGVCTASPVVKIPVALYGKTLKFTATFKGNAVVKKFTKSANLLVKLPDPVPATPAFLPTVGPWTIKQVPTVANTQQWSFAVGADGSVTKIDRLTGLNVACTGEPNGFLQIPEAPFDTPFKIGATSLTVSDQWTDPTEPLATTTSTFVLSFDSTGHATGTFRLTGSISYMSGVAATPTVFTGCDSGPINVELAPGIFA